VIEGVTMQVFDIPLTNELQEITRHISDDFPVSIYKTCINKNVYGYVPLHWHEELQLILVVKGRAKFTVDGDVHIIEKGDGLFINARFLHSSRLINNESCTYICIDFLSEVIDYEQSLIFSKYIKPIVNDRRLKAVKLERTNKWQSNVLTEMLKIEHVFSTEDLIAELLIKKSLLDIWVNLFSNLDFNNEFDFEFNNSIDMQAEAIINYIHANYVENMSLNDLASISNLSRSECSRVFKRNIGVTPFEYLNRYRLTQSMHLIRKSKKTITEVAYEVGFNSTSYFISSFKRLTGLTPLQFRKS